MAATSGSRWFSAHLGAGPKSDCGARNGRLDLGRRIRPLRHRPAGAVAPGERPHAEANAGYAMALRRGAEQTNGVGGARGAGDAGEAREWRARGGEENSREEGDGVRSWPEEEMLNVPNGPPNGP